MTAPTRRDLQHHPWCRSDRDVYRLDDGHMTLLRCRDCRAELVRHRRPRPDDGPAA